MLRAPLLPSISWTSSVEMYTLFFSSSLSLCLICKQDGGGVMTLQSVCASYRGKVWRIWKHVTKEPSRTSKCHCIPSLGFMLAIFSSSALTYRTKTCGSNL